MVQLSHLKCVPVLPGKLQTIPAVFDDSDRKSDLHREGEVPRLIHRDSVLICINLYLLRTSQL